MELVNCRKCSPFAALSPAATPPGRILRVRGMPPGPRFYSIPLFGNFLSFDSGAGKSLYESTQRWVSILSNLLTAKIMSKIGIDRFTTSVA